MFVDVFLVFVLLFLTVAISNELSDASRIRRHDEINEIIKSPQYLDAASTKKTLPANKYVVFTDYYRNCSVPEQVKAFGSGACVSTGPTSSYMYVVAEKNYSKSLYTTTDCSGTPFWSTPGLLPLCTSGCSATGLTPYQSSYCSISTPFEKKALVLKGYATQAGCKSASTGPRVEFNYYLGCFKNGTNSIKYSCTASNSTVYTYKGTSCSGSPLSSSTLAFPQCSVGQSGYYYSGVCVIGAAPTPEPTVRVPAPPSTNSPAVAWVPVAERSDDQTMLCFAGSETVELETGAVISIADVKMGDRVLAADMSGKTVFSEVVSVPHGRNNDRRAFTQIRTVGGCDIKLTSDHLILNGECNSDHSLVLTSARNVKVGSCVQSVSGREKVVANEIVEGYGFYTFVTHESLVVVNGFVASPFSSNHAVANAFYNVHRAVYLLAPSLLRLEWVKRANLAFGAIVRMFSA